MRLAAVAPPTYGQKHAYSNRVATKLKAVSMFSKVHMAAGITIRQAAPSALDTGIATNVRCASSKRNNHCAVTTAASLPPVMPADDQPTNGFLGTIISDDKKACWLSPKGGPMAAKGVVLFMHGFSQGPNAYYKLLQELAQELGVLVVAPVPPLAATPEEQQTAMVEFATHFHSKIYSNELTGLPLPSPDVAQNIALLGHSVGAGLSSYVASEKAREGQAFEGVMYMAPQTEVVDKFSPKIAINNWPSSELGSTQFGLQYGLKDQLAPPRLATALEAELKDKQLSIKASDVFQYINGTHVGFQDQVVLGNLEVVPDILPWLNPILLFLTYLGFPFATFIAIKLTRLFQPKENGQQDQQQPQSPNLAGRSSSTTGTSSRIVHRAVRTLLLSPGEAALSTRGAQIQAKREAAPQILEAEARKQRQAWKQQANGIGEEEEVEMASAEVSTAAYASLLTVVVALFLYLGYRVWTGFQDSDPNIPWLSLVGFALTGFAVYEGASNLAIYNYVNTVQRPQSRDHARDFIGKTLKLK